MVKKKPHIDQFEVKNWGPLPELKWENLGAINLVLGENSCGKTYILKSLYAAAKVVEHYRRGKNPNSLKEELYKKLYWTFEVPDIKSLIQRNASSKKAGALSFSFSINQEKFSYQLCAGGLKVENRTAPFLRAEKKHNSLFFPAKEVLSSHSVIVNSRDEDQAFGFDDTYYDLAKVLQMPRLQGKNYKEFAEARGIITDLCQGRANYDPAQKKWMVIRNGINFEASEVSEGIKKLSILDILLSNRYLTNDSIVFIDEPEASLHPKAISLFMEIIYKLSQKGIQFFLATHSYFVIKKLENIARKESISLPVLSYQNEEWVKGDLCDGLPDNPIVDESIRLYQEEIAAVLS